MTITVKNAAGTDVDLKTSTDGTDQVPHHNVDALPATDSANLAAIKAAIEILDNIVAGNEAQVDVVSLPSIPAGSNLIGKVNTTPILAFSRLAVDLDTAGDNELVVATAGQTIRVCGFFLMSGGNVDITFKSNTTQISGPLPLAIKGNGLLLPVVEDGFHYMVTASGEALNLGLSDNVPVGGFLIYRKS